jgi:hypothetical protein
MNLSAVIIITSILVLLFILSFAFNFPICGDNSPNVKEGYVFQIKQEPDSKTGIIYNYTELFIGGNKYKVLIDTGSPNLVIDKFNVADSVPITTDKYDSYTVYGGNNATIEQCITASETGGALANECVVQKYYNTDNIPFAKHNVTVFAGIYGSTPSILGLAMPGLTSSGSREFKLPTSDSGKKINIKPLVNWLINDNIQNFTVDFKNNLLTFSDTDKYFTFYPRVKFYGFHTDFYAMKCNTLEMGEINVVFDTGCYDCIVPGQINSEIKKGNGKLSIISPFNVLIDSSSKNYETISPPLDFIIMGYKHMISMGKIYFDNNRIGILPEGLSTFTGFVKYE